MRILMAAMLAATAGAAAPAASLAVPPAVRGFARRLGDASPGGGAKVVASWTGDAVDLGCGSLAGFAGGLCLGGLIEGTASLVRHCAFTGVAVWAAQANGLVEVHWANVRRMRASVVPWARATAKKVDPSAELAAQRARVLSLAQTNRHRAAGAVLGVGAGFFAM